MAEIDSNLNELSILRCPVCKLIPIIKSNLSENTLEYKCPNNHNEKGIFNIIYEKLKKDNNINNMKCCKCLKAAEIYCSKCFKFYCENDKENEEDHYKINIKDIDNYCFKDNEKIVMYCKTENKLLCGECEHEDNNCEIVPIKQLLFKNDVLEKFNKKINEIKNLDTKKNDSKYIKILNELENILLSYIDKIKEIKKSFENNDNKEKTYHNFYNDLLNSYQYKKEKNTINFNIINNLSNNFEQDFNFETNNFSYIFTELNSIINSIEYKYYDILFENSSSNYLRNNFLIFNTKTIKQIEYEDDIFCSKVLYDKRLAIGGKSSNLYVINNYSLDIDIKINNNLSDLYDINQLKNHNLVLCFRKIIRIMRIFNKNYNIIQNINDAHESQIWNSLELSNQILVSSSHDKNLKFWSNENENNLYKEVFTIEENNYLNDLIEIKPNEIAYDIYDNRIKFYNYSEKKVIKIFDDLKLTCAGIGRTMALMSNRLILVANERIYYFNILNYTMIKEISFECKIYCVTQLNENMFIVGDDNGNLNQFDVFSESNQSISLINNAHKSDINTISVFNNYLVTGGDDNILKIWK